MDQQEVLYEDFSPEFEAFVNATMAESNTLGMAVLLLHKGRTWAKGFGFSDVIQKMPVTPRTLFFAGSTTKSFTAAMAAGLAESQEHANIHWDTPLTDLIKEDFVLDPTTPEGRHATAHITLEDALSHRTGMPRHDMIWMNGDLSNRDIVRALRHVSAPRMIRTKWQYCNNMYTAVAHSIAETLDKPFKVLLKDHIFDPLGMRCTTYDLSDAQNLVKDLDDIDLARGHLWDSRATEHITVDWEDLPSANGAGGIISNVLDYCLWVRHLLRPTNMNAALGEQAVKAMRTPRMLLEADPTKPYVGPQAYGLGLNSQVYRGRELLQHSGAISGYMASFVIVPPTKAEIQNGDFDNGWAIVTMQNSYSLAQDIVTWNLLDTLLETPEAERFNMAQVARYGQAMKEEEMQSSNVLQRLYGDVDVSLDKFSTFDPQRYVGTYGHQAYHELKVSASPPAMARDIKANEEAKTLYLMPGSTKTSCAVWASLHHVSGDWWWAHSRMGPCSSWITDSASKLQFVVGHDGVVEGMNFQAMPDEEFAFFRRVG